MPRWLIYSLLTVLFWGVWGALFKALDGISATQAQAFSTLGVLPILLALMAATDLREGEHKLRGALAAFVAGVLVGLGNIGYYQALAVPDGKAATAAALTAIYPISTIVLALVLLKERPSTGQLVGIAGSIGAIYLLSGSQPGGTVSGWLGYALAPIALWGIAALIMKVATEDVSASLATFSFLASFALLGVVLLGAVEFSLVGGEPIKWSLSPREWLLLTLIGATYGLGNLTLLAAYRNGGQASIVTPMAGLYPVITIPVAIAFFGESVGVREGAGIALALAAGIALSSGRKGQPDLNTGAART